MSLAFDMASRAKWGGRAQAYAETFAGQCAHAISPMLDALDLQPGERLLDVGTGAGAVAVAALVRGVRVTAADPLGLGTFWATFESWSDAERAQAIQPLMNKLRTVLLRPALRGIFGQRRPRFQISDVFTKHRVLLVALG